MHVWDAQKLLELGHDAPEKAHVVEIRKRVEGKEHRLHGGSVTAMEFNCHSSSSHLLASGAA